MVDTTAQQYEVPHAKKIKYNLDPTAVRAMVTGFKAYDTDNSGSMDKKELKKLLIDLGMREITNEEVEACMKEVDTDADELISWNEFIDMYGK